MLSIVSSTHLVPQVWAGPWLRGRKTGVPVAAASSAQRRSPSLWLASVPGTVHAYSLFCSNLLMSFSAWFLNYAGASRRCPAQDGKPGDSTWGPHRIDFLSRHASTDIQATVRLVVKHLRNISIQPFQLSKNQEACLPIRTACQGLIQLSHRRYPLGKRLSHWVVPRRTAVIAPENVQQSHFRGCTLG